MANLGECVGIRGFIIIAGHCVADWQQSFSQDTEQHALVRRGERTCAASVVFSPVWAHAIALSETARGIGCLWSVERIPNPRLRLASVNLVIVKPKGIPQLIRPDGPGAKVSTSLSHHGEFVAAALIWRPSPSESVCVVQSRSARSQEVLCSTCTV